MHGMLFSFPDLPAYFTWILTLVLPRNAKLCALVTPSIPLMG